MTWRRSRIILLALLWWGTGRLEAQRFLADDPIRSDPDDLPIERPAMLELSPTFDALTNTLGIEGTGRRVAATNINTLGLVPDSSWFTNRLGARDFSIAEIVQGGILGNGPDFSLIKIMGATLSSPTGDLFVKDARGDTYLVRFDRRHHPNLATGAEIISSRFLYAAGYHVFPTSLVRLDPARFEIAPGATVRMLGGRSEELTAEFIQSVLEASVQDANGHYRATAAGIPEGEVVGRFQFFGTRQDDPNDIFLHENRRELRALQLFVAWLNHTDCNSPNTMDIWVTEGGRPHLRHYLADLSSSLGSGHDLNHRTIPKDPGSGYEYSLLADGSAVLKTAFSLGLWERPWLNVRYPYPRLEEIGRIEADYFQPYRWKPDYPNAAFRHQLLDDALWAARILSHFTDDTIHAVVELAGYSNPEATEYLAEILAKRRDKVLDYHLRRVNPLVDFRVAEDSPSLLFNNLGSERGIDRKVSYRYEWSVFNNTTGATQSIGTRRYTGLPALEIPPHDADYLRARIVTLSDVVEAWSDPVDVYLRNRPQGWKVVGVEHVLPE